VPDKPTLVQTLRTTSEALRAIRKTVAKSGHIREMTDVDTLVQVAQVEAEKLIMMAEQPSARS